MISFWLIFSLKVYRTEPLSTQQVAAVEALREALPEIEFWDIPAVGSEVRIYGNIKINLNLIIISNINRWALWSAGPDRNSSSRICERKRSNWPRSLTTSTSETKRSFIYLCNLHQWIFSCLKTQKIHRAHFLHERRRQQSAQERQVRLQLARLPR